MTPSCAGIAACACSKTRPTDGTSWNRNWFRSMLKTLRQDSNLRRPFESEYAKQPLQGIEVTVDYALLEWNNRVLGDGNRLGTHLPATSGDVAVANVMAVPQVAHPVFGVKRMHFECRRIDEQTRTDKLLVLVVFAQDVTHVLAEKTLDTLAKFLHALNVGLLNAPCAIGRVWRAGLELLDEFLGPEVPRDIRDQIAYDWERVHRLQDDRRVQVEVTEAGHAHEFGHAVDLGGARSTFAGLAVPSHRHVRCLLGLDAVHDVENDHSFLNGYGVVLESAARIVSAPDSKCR